MSTITSHIPDNLHTHRSAQSTTTSRSSVSSPAAAPTPSSSACAACKYQRRKCTPDCPLAPYFPADKQRQFLNAHRLFGVSNILKILKSVEPDRHSEAMQSIIYQSNARANDPIGGCYRIILNLQHQINTAYAELQLILRHIDFYRSQVDAAASMGSMQAPDVNPSLLLTPAAADEAVVYGNISALMQQHQQQQYHNYYYYDEGQVSDSADHHHDDEINHNNGVPEFDMNNNSVENQGLEMEVPLQMLSFQHKADANDQMSQLRHAFVISEVEGDSKDVNDHTSSKHEVMKDDQSDLMEQVEEDDLRSAASLFTLTNYNASPV